ncbi:MAG: RNB domain-containing ribonuclease [Thermodesulfobacteriota bacterium]|nr:RNB domain-containing ribonuclease [Thermodesulfobacteriota bacterium]
MTLQGKIIEYLDQSKFICALVTQDSGKRLRILNQKGREMNLPLSRVVHHTGLSYAVEQSREDVQRLLQETAEKRQALTEPVDLEEIWELASEEDESSFSPDFLAGLSFGEDASDDHIASFLRCVFKDHLFFKYKAGKVLVHSAETVQQLRDKAEKEKAREELLDQGARALEILKKGREPENWPEREKCLALLREYYLQGNDAPESAVAREILKRARLTRPHDAFHLLVTAGVWDKNENIPLLRQDLPVEFSPEVLLEAEVDEPSTAELLADGRLDLLHLPVMTIDGESTRDFDDGLHVEKRENGFMVGIHIADVTPWVTPGSQLFSSAVERGTSIYFPEGQIPMLPPSLSEGVCSLICDRVRPALSFMVLISAEGEILDHSVQRSVVRVKRRLTYGQVDEMLEDDEELKILSLLSLKLQQRRIDNGAMLLPIPDVNVTVCDDDVDVRLNEVDTPGRTLVAEFMVLANSVGASYFCDREISALYRSQALPRRRLIHGYDKDLFLNFRQRRNLSRGELSTKPKLHSGVGVSQYTTLTSPIRRLLDMLMQHQLTNVLKGDGPLFTLAECKQFGGKTLAVLSRANQVRYQRHRYWLLKYLEKRVGEKLSVLILEIQPRRIQVVIKDVLLEGDLPLNQGVRVEPGDVIRVKLAKANALDNTLRLEW